VLATNRITFSTFLHFSIIINRDKYLIVPTLYKLYFLPSKFSFLSNVVHVV
jgi:hypothetical protein